MKKRTILQQFSTCYNYNNSYFNNMNLKNLVMWAVIVFLTIVIYNMFKNPQGSIVQKNNIIFS